MCKKKVFILRKHNHAYRNGWCTPQIARTESDPDPELCMWGGGVELELVFVRTTAEFRTVLQGHLTLGLVYSLPLVVSVKWQWLYCREDIG